MDSKRPKLPNLPKLTRRNVFRAIAIGAIVIAVLVIATAGYVYYQAVKTFEIRRVSLPTRIFTDQLPLRPGVAVDDDLLQEKLERLGYRQAAVIQQPGDFTASKGSIDIYLRPFKHPAGDHAAQRVHLTLTNEGIGSVTGERGAVEDAALEPELLTSILSDQLENRRPVTLDQVPQHLIDAIIVTEDLRFFSHPGVDPIGIFRAVFRNVAAGGVSEGASTLTQQLVKNYYLSSERTFKRKLVEAFMAVILDAKYSKKEILEAYVNDIYLGRNRSISIIGVGEASRFYFGKPVSELTPAEAALIAGMIRGPNNYSPFTSPDRAIARRNIVLGLMLKHEKLTQAEYQQALEAKLPNRPTREKGGLSSIPFYVDRVLQELKTDYGISDVKGRGLSIYTAIDLNMQNLAAQTLASGIANLEKSSRRLRRANSPLQGVLMAVDVPTGEIRALVGGRNYDQSQFNRALYAKRQVGSLFKPFVYLTAFEPSLSGRNITPATLVNDSRFVYKQRFSKDWSPRNYGDEYHGVVTVREALEQSMNSASVRLGLAAGVDNIIKTAHVLGVEEELDPVPSIILGSVGVPPIEMAEAYTTIAREGSRVPLRTVRYVMNDRGRGVSSPKDEPVQVFPARDVYLGLRIMQGVVDRGTAAGSRSYGFTKIAAGKTGTTNEKRDAWFIGFTPQTLAVTWLGFDDNAPVGLSGSDGAVPIWSKFMKQATAMDPNRDFPPPSGIVFVPVDATSGGLATPYCPRNAVVNDAFKAGTEPTQPCPIHNVVAPPPIDLSMQPTITDTTMTDTMAPLAPGETATVSPSDTRAPMPTLTGGPGRDQAPPPQPPPTDTTETSSGT